MAFEEKITWLSLVVMIGVATAYTWVVGSRAATLGIANTPYQVPIIVAVVATIVLTVVGSVFTGMISSGVAVVQGEDPNEAVRSDERDSAITARGNRLGQGVFALGLAVPFALTLLGASHFWIANSMFAAMVAGSAVASVIKLIAYRRGW